MGALLGVDHLVFAVPDLVDAVACFADRSGVQPVPGGRHRGLGSANYLVKLGEHVYLEIVGPDPDRTDSDDRLPFGLETLTAPALVTWAIRTRDIDADIARSRSHGYDPGPAVAMSRKTTDGTVLEWRLTPDTIDDDGCGLVPFLIDWGTSPHPTSNPMPQVSLLAMTATSPNPDGIGQRLNALGVNLAVDYGPIARLHAVLRTPQGELPLN